MEAGGMDRTGGALATGPRLVVLAGASAPRAVPVSERCLTRREWKVVAQMGDVLGLPVTTWRTAAVAAVPAPIRHIRRRRRPLALRRRIWFGVAALCLFTLGTLP